MAIGRTAAAAATPGVLFLEGKLLLEQQQPQKEFLLSHKEPVQV